MSMEVYYLNSVSIKCVEQYNNNTDGMLYTDLNILSGAAALPKSVNRQKRINF
jgi:hypothetical protein